MAVEASDKPVLPNKFDDDDDDNMPLTIKRYSSNKKSQLHSDVKKSTSHSQDGHTYKRISGVPSSNGQSSSSSAQRGNNFSSAKASSLRSPPSSSSNAQKGSAAPSAKASPLRSPTSSSASAQKGNAAPSAKVSPLRSPSSSSSSAQKGNTVPLAKASPLTSPLRSPVGVSKRPNSLANSTSAKLPMANSKPPHPADKPKPLINQKVSGDLKKETKSIKDSSKNYSEDSEDEEDNKPLSARLKVNSNHNKATPVIIKKSVDDSDSDDNVPLSTKINWNANMGTSSSNYDKSDQKKPIPKVQKEPQNGSGASNKRPIDNSNSMNSSAKKSKISEPALSVKPKQSSLKVEPKVEDDDDDVPISQRIKKSATSANKSSSIKQVTKITKVNKASTKSFKKQAKNKKLKKSGSGSEYSKSTKLLPSSGDGQKKWTTLVHNGVIFPPPYKPHGIKMRYKDQDVDLTPEQEEVATMYAVMLETDYMLKEKFKENFWTDWRKLLGKNHVIQNLKDCDFRPIYNWYQSEKEKKKQMTADEKKALKEEKIKQEEKYMWAIVDGVKEKVGNFRVEPPGLFRGRGEHPKMGKLKRRIHPSDITINIGKDAPVPECPIPGEKWKEIRHDDTVTWLAFWNDPINPKLFKYVFLAASSALKGQSDKEKYEKARMLKDYIENIRAAYTKDFKSKDITKQQIAVATYLIDKLALRAGNEKDDDEADTVGCCTLKVENVTREAPNKLKFNFLGKDSIKYENTVEVELPVYDAILKFQKDKRPGDDLFDKLDTSKLNAHLKELMPGLTAKVFRTFNASITLDDMLNKETKEGDVVEKILVYQHANKQVAIICNHQRSVSKSHSSQIEKLTNKIGELQAREKDLSNQCKD